MLFNPRIHVWSWIILHITFKQRNSFILEQPSPINTLAATMANPQAIPYSNLQKPLQYNTKLRSNPPLENHMEPTHLIKAKANSTHNSSKVYNLNPTTWELPMNGTTKQAIRAVSYYKNYSRHFIVLSYRSLSQLRMAIMPSSMRLSSTCFEN